MTRLPRQLLQQLTPSSTRGDLSAPSPPSGRPENHGETEPEQTLPDRVQSDHQSLELGRTPQLTGGDREPHSTLAGGCHLPGATSPRGTRLSQQNESLSEPCGQLQFKSPREPAPLERREPQSAQGRSKKNQEHVRKEGGVVTSRVGQGNGIRRERQVQGERRELDGGCGSLVTPLVAPSSGSHSQGPGERILEKGGTRM